MANVLSIERLGVGGCRAGLASGGTQRAEGGDARSDRPDREREDARKKPVAKHAVFAGSLDEREERDYEGKCTEECHDADPAREDSAAQCEQSGSREHHGKAHCGDEVWPRRGTGHRSAHHRIHVGALSGCGSDHHDRDCVGLEQAVVTALEIARPGGAVGRVGVPEHDTTPTGIAFWKNASVAGGPAPVRAYIDELLPEVLEGRIEPGRVFDRTGSLDEVPDGYRAMNDRDVLKFQIAF